MRWVLIPLVALAVMLSGCPSRTTVAPVPPAPSEAPETSVPAPAPTYACHRAAGPITVDGSPEEEAWQQAGWPTKPFAKWNGLPAHTETTARLLWDDQYLYVAFECEDPDIQGSMKQRDESLWEENEVVELFADAGADQGCYLEFEINPLNTVVDLVIPKAGAPGPVEGKKMWDAKGMKTAAATDSGGWRVEMAIPLDCFLDAPNTPPKPGDGWRINLYRVDAVSDQVEYQAWVPTNTPEPSFHVPERFGVLRFEGGGGGEADES